MLGAYLLRSIFLKPNNLIVFKQVTETSTRNHLAKILKVNDDKLLVRIEKDSHIKNETAEVDVSNIVATLGKNPPAGKVFGVDTSRIFRSTVVSESGLDIHFFTKVDESVKAKAVKGFDRAVSHLKKIGMDFIVHQPIVYEVLTKTGKYAGMYVGHKKADEANPSRIQLFLNKNGDFEDASTYVFVHEFGHAIDHFFLRSSKKIMAEWVNLYSRSIAPTTVLAADGLKLGKAFLTMTSVGEWKSSLEDRSHANLITRYIKQVHGVTPQDLNVLIDAEDYTAIKALWPRCDLHSHDLKPLVSEYSTVSVKETIAEAFAFYATGKQLPKGVTSLVEKSIQYAIGQR